MASFDIFCEPHMGCIKVAVDAANELVKERYDWRHTNATYRLKANSIVITAESRLQLEQMLRELCVTLRRELVHLAFLSVKHPTNEGRRLTLRLGIERGITREWANFLMKEIKATRIPAKCQFKNGEVLVNTLHIDDAQQLIAQMRLKRYQLPIHYRNLTQH